MIQMTDRRDGVRDLLRHRRVQAILLAAAALQAAVTVHKVEEARAEQARGKSRSAAVAVSRPNPTLAPVVVAQLQLDSAPVKEAPSEAKPVEPHAEALALADRYEKNGFRVSDALAKAIYEAASENDIDPEVAFGLVKTESGFKNQATSHVGAVGLTQLMPRTARWLEPGTTVRDLRDPETNLRIGFRYLRDLLDKYDGNTRLALLAYNRGPGTVDKVLRRGGNPDNGYVEMVMGRRKGH